MTNWVEIGNARLACGDSMEILQEIETADAVVTDPPYGVMLGESKNRQAIAKNQMKYRLFSDTPEYIETKIIPIIEYCINKFRRVVLTPGNRNMFLYPQPEDMGIWFNPAGTSRTKWGYSCGQPIFYYGKDPRAGKGSTPNGTWGKYSRTKEIINHPCPKPLPFMQWLVEKASLPGEIVLDPFMGSGTTAIAALQLDRKFIGIELDREYFDEACRRIEEAQKQGNLFRQEKKQIKEQQQLI